MDNKSLSEAIRMKKKKLMSSEPEMVGTSPVPDMNAQDIYDVTQKGRIEETLDSPHKINAKDTNMEMSYQGVGVSPEEKSRMGRLKAYFDKMGM